jgi:hypothetical protein
MVAAGLEPRVHMSAAYGVDGGAAAMEAVLGVTAVVTEYDLLAIEAMFDPSCVQRWHTGWTRAGILIRFPVR